jgi:hypothetical protein
MQRRGTFASILIGISAFCSVGPSGAQEPSHASYEATLRRACPAKNLDFLPTEQVSRTLAAFIERLPRDRRDRVVEDGRSEVAACGSGDGQCAAQAALGALRRQGLAGDFAREVCALPLRCTEVSECGPDTSSPTPGRVASADEALNDAPRAIERRDDGPAPLGPHGLLRTPPRPATPRDAALGFYRALGRGDGIGAEWFVIAEKRGSGPFVASNIERFYGNLPGPLTVVSAEETGPSTVAVRYRFVTHGGGVCDGRSTVTVRDTAEGYRIARIDAPSAC